MVPKKSCTIAEESAIIINRLLDAFRDEFKRVGSEWTADSIHDLRVSCRRLRSALLLFSPYYDSNVYLRYRKSLKVFMNRLSTLRDIDVQLEMLGEMDKPKAEYLLQKWHDLIRFLTEKKQKLDRDLQKYIKRRSAILSFNLPAPVKGCDMSSADAFPLLFDKKVMETKSLISEVNWEKPFSSQEALHSVRIAFKKLRYTLEIFKSLSHSKADKIIENLKHTQDLLGWIHDCDVMYAEVRKLVKRHYKFIKTQYFNKLDSVIWQTTEKSSNKSTSSDFTDIVLYLSRRIAEKRRKHFNQAKKTLNKFHTSQVSI
ncbi:MAG: CHAD domain-containing protein [Candidatus Riflebacteria bacterium]|nr:CHAD domain-containing protein [Candidatus Riflebacteria bacterium]